jgi:hypothetical protein
MHGKGTATQGPRNVTDAARIASLGAQGQSWREIGVETCLRKQHFLGGTKAKPDG